MPVYDLYPRLDPPAGHPGDGYDLWPRLNAPDAPGGGPIYLDLVGGAKATTKAGAQLHVAALLLSGAKASSKSGASVSVLVTPAGGAKANAAAGAPVLPLLTARGGAGVRAKAGAGLTVLTLLRGGAIAYTSAGGAPDIDTSGFATVDPRDLAQLLVTPEGRALLLLAVALGEPATSITGELQRLLAITSTISPPEPHPAEAALVVVTRPAPSLTIGAPG